MRLNSERRMAELDKEVQRKVQKKQTELACEFAKIEREKEERERNYLEKKKRLIRANLCVSAVVTVVLSLFIGKMFADGKDAGKTEQINELTRIVEEYEQNDYYVCIEPCNIVTENGEIMYCYKGTSVILLTTDEEQVKMISTKGNIGYIDLIEWNQNFQKATPFLRN